jgi:hypothetical protein
MDTEDRWYVDVGGSPKMMTLDELVEAYEAGQITAQSLVTEVGGTEWRTLSEVADLGEEEEEPAPASVRAPVHAQSYAPQPTYPRQAVAASGSAWPPVAVANPSRPSVAATSAISHSATLPPQSMAPVVQDLSYGLDDDMPFKKSGKNKFALIGVAAALALGAAGFGLTRGGGETTTAPVAAAAVPMAFNTPSTPTPSTPTPSTPAASPAPSEASDSDKPGEEAKSGRLSEDMKAALLAQDKGRSAKKKGGGAKSGGGARARAPRSSSKSDSVFRSGGSADDPLNSKL